MKIGLTAHKVHRRGGMERAAAEVFERIAQKHDVAIIASECEISGDRLTWSQIKTRERPAFLRAWLFSRLARQEERKLNCTVTNTIGAAALEADVITAQFCHAAFTAQYGGLRGGKGIRKLYQSLVQRYFVAEEKRAYTSRRLKKVISVSEGVKRELIKYYKVPAEKIIVIPNGVDHNIFRPTEGREEKLALRRKLGLPENHFLCLFVGGDWERKGLSDAIHALAGLEEVSLVVVGKGNIPLYKSVAEKANCLDQVIFAGVSVVTEKYYAAADVFVFPSRYEAFSLVTIEAVASGLPILALPINGVEELITEGENGFFITESPESIRDKIQELKSNRNTLSRMSAAAIISSRQYSWDKIATQQLEVFESVSAG